MHTDRQTITEIARNTKTDARGDKMIVMVRKVRRAREVTTDVIY